MNIDFPHFAESAVFAGMLIVETFTRASSKNPGKWFFIGICQHIESKTAQRKRFFLMMGEKEAGPSTLPWAARPGASLIAACVSIPALFQRAKEMVDLVPH